MTEEERAELLAQGLVAVIATEQPDGRPHLTPIWFSWDGTDFEVLTPASSRKYKNLQRQPRCTMSVDKKTWPYRSVIAECDVNRTRQVRGYPEGLVGRYLADDLAATFVSTFRDLALTAVTLRPTRWYGHINRG